MNLFVLSVLGLLSISDAASIKVSPGDSIQTAIDKAMPGDTVVLSDGEYSEDLVTVRDGEKDNRITITGSHNAILRGTGKKGRMFEIHHDYHTIDGFEINGMLNDGKKESDYIDKGIYAHGDRKPRVIKQYGKEFKSAIDGLEITNMRIVNFGGECSRMRYYITNAIYAGNHVENCGVHDFEFGGMKSVNGETLYIGTSSNQWKDGKNPTPDDESRYIHVHHNVFESYGNEVDVKEGTSDVVIEYNSCSTQKDPNSACLDSRTDNVIFRYNELFGNDGSGVRIGGHTIKGHTFGQNNEVYGNVFRGNKAGALKVQTGPHKGESFCDNKCEGKCEVGGSVSKDYQDIESKCGSVMDTYWINSDKLVIDKKSVSKVEKESKTELTSPGLEVGVEDDSSEDEDEEEVDCFPVKITGVKASSSDGENSAALAVDGKSLTRWSAKGAGEWIELDLGKDTEVVAVGLSTYRGDERVQKFDVFVSGEGALADQVTSGKTLSLEFFEFQPIVTDAVTLIGNCNSANDWNSLTEVVVCGKSQDIDHDEKEDSTDECTSVKELEITDIESSSDDGNVVENLLDGDLTTKWSAIGPDEQTVTLKLEPSHVSEIGIAVFDGKNRIALFDILVHTERGWEEIIVDGESSPSSGMESYDIGVDNVEEIKIVGYGYKKAETGETGIWNSLVGIEVYGC